MLRTPLAEETRRIFFSPRRRRAIRVVNQADLLFGSSWASPATLESIESRDGSRGLGIKKRRLLLGPREARIDGPHSVRGRQRIEATPASIGLSDDGAHVALSYRGDYQEGWIESYEIRSWPDLELVHELPERSVFSPRTAYGPSTADRQQRSVMEDGPLRVSPGGRFIATARNNMLTGAQGLAIVDVPRAAELPRVRFDEAVLRLHGSSSKRARIGEFLFSDDGLASGGCSFRTSYSWWCAGCWKFHLTGIVRGRTGPGRMRTIGDPRSGSVHAFRAA